jgi:UDP-3-O-[3-hydroxymyristoyl] glucosamine N-acyltransferase
MSLLKMTLAEIRAFIGEGEIVGLPDFYCQSVASLDQAQENQLSFVKDGRYFDKALQSAAGALLVPEEIEGYRGNQLVVADSHRVFGQLLAKVALEKRRQPAGIHPGAWVDENARIGSDVTIGAGAVVREGATIGDRSVLYAGSYVGQRSVVGTDTILYPNVLVLEDVTIGERVLIHGGTVVGSDGYGFVQHEGRHLKIPQVGGVVIGNDVEIGALTTIDRATLDQTVIGNGTKIGDLCHIAHNCQIGENVLVLPTVAISGSVTVGDGAIFAGRSGCADNLTIGAGAVLGGTSVAFKDVPAGAQMWGNPAREKMQEMRIQGTMRRLPEMQRELRALKKKVGL